MANYLSPKLTFTLLIGVPLFGFGQQAPSLPELASRAISKSYELANAELAIKTDQETRKGIRETYIPHLEANGKYAYMDGELLVDLPTTSLPLLNIPLFDGRETFRGRGNLWTSDLTASAVLFSGTQVPKLGKAVDEKIKAQEFMLEKSRQEIISKVSTAYDQIALLQQVQKLLAESRRRLEIEQKTAEKAFTYGLITAYELNKVSVASAALEARQVEYEGKHRLLIKQLHILTDVSTDSLALINHALQPYSVPSTDAASIRTRPELNALDAAISANEYQLQAARAHWIPQVKAMARIGYYGLTNGSLKTPYTFPLSGQPIQPGINRLQSFPTYMVGVGFRWNLFDGLQGKRAVNKAKIELLKAENNRKQAEELVQLDLAKAQTEYNLSNKQVIAGERRLETAAKALDIAQKEYRTGLIKPAERVEAETDYQQAALDYYQTVFNQRRAAYQLLIATGKLDLEQLN
ncbi:TolC family protein [Parapedobacter soli]|uniref:TolC family protein n=1 Tax=Parapedobacter soli TaxID=416955 RepID=UPI0021C6EF06|nr:TolC family protein [Parapedobacter soli]